MFNPVWYRRSAGIRPTTPPSWKQAVVTAAAVGVGAVHAPVLCGSRMYGKKLPLLSVDCEKSPARSSAVGIR